MKTFDITFESSLEHASRRLEAQERFAARSRVLLRRLISTAGAAIACAMRRDDEALDFEIASGYAYLAHLIAMEDLRARIDADG
jgi:hypothetical protein